MRREGFTLVELAIVLVIIGIILGAVLKGQELVFNSKVKRVQSQLKEMVAAFYTYYDKYGYYAGDDPNASSRWTGVPNGNGDGQVGGDYCDGNNEESCYLFRHLRYAGIISGDPTQTTPAILTPKHSFGGSIHMFTGTYNVGGVDQSGLWVALQNLEAPAAEAIDRAIDDGKCTTGSMARYNGTNCSGAIIQLQVI